MSIKEKMRNVNKSTKNLPTKEVLEQLGCSHQGFRVYLKPKLIKKLLMYLKVFDFELILENKHGDRIVITEDDVIPIEK